jgi:GTP-binding protein HflX
MTTLNKLKSNKKVAERAYLIGLSSLSKIDYLKEELLLNELKELVESAGAIVVGHAIQKRKSPHPATYIGEGKLIEIINLINTLDINLLVINGGLSGTQQMVIESKTGIKVLDRNAVILDVFATRAKSREALLQVSLAQNEYLLPRLRGQWTHLERFSGGIGSRGPGETQLETDRRLVSQRISLLRKKIKKIYAHRARLRSNRTKNSIPNVGIIGYTNAGKSSMMQAICKRKPSVANRPFETLDTTTGKVWVNKGLYFSITDTVGFFSNLPIELTSAFKATIEEINNADILLHVVDGSSINVGIQIDSVKQALIDLGLSSIPMITLINKIDLINNAVINDISKNISTKFTNNIDCIATSTKKDIGIVQVKNALKYELFGQ